MDRAQIFGKKLLRHCYVIPRLKLYRRHQGQIVIDLFPFSLSAWWQIILAIEFWFKVDYYLTIMFSMCPSSVGHCVVCSSFLVGFVLLDLYLCVCFVDRCLSFCPFSFGHCVVCSSVFWPLCCLFFCLLAIVLSVLLSFGHCVVCSSSVGHCVVCFSSICVILIVPLVSSNSS